MTSATRFESATLDVGRTLGDAMWKLEQSGLEIVLAVDDAGRLVGVLTDGDVRRALLAGATMTTPIASLVKREFTSVGPEVSRAEVLDLMQARTIAQIPILDADRKLVGLHKLHEVISPRERPNWCVLMAGGKGTRLLPLTESIPKPMIKVAGRPILERLILHLVGHGFRRIFLSVNYLGHVVEDHFGDGAGLGCRIEYLREREALDTGGALGLLPELPDEPILVMNADLVTQVDVGAMIDRHRETQASVTVGVKKYFHVVPYGCVDLAGDRIVGLAEKPCLTQLVNAGIYALSAGVVAGLPRGKPFTMPWVIEQTIARGEPVRAFEIEEEWIDVGQRDQLRAARGGGG